MKESDQQLRQIALEIRGVAFLIEQFALKDGLPLDNDDCWYGVGSVLTRHAEQLRKIADTAELKDKKARKPTL